MRNCMYLCESVCVHELLLKGETSEAAAAAAAVAFHQRQEVDFDTSAAEHCGPLKADVLLKSVNAATTVKLI